jgi:carbamoyltransferase
MFMNNNKYILGLNCAYHESSVCILKEGKIISFMEEERLNRIKHAKLSRIDNADDLPVNAINYCLTTAGISLKEVAYIGFSLNPEKRLQINTKHVYPYEPTKNDFGTDEGERIFYSKTRNVETKLREDGFIGTFYYLNHHDCHAAGAYFSSGFKSSAVLVVDGIGEYETTAVYQAQNSTLKVQRTLEYPNSLGFLWEKISKFLGFSEYDVAKVMGLASYGNPSIYRNAFRELVGIRANGDFSIEDSIIQFRSDNYCGLEKLFNQRKRDHVIRIVDRSTKEYADIAASLQETTEGILLRLCRNIQTESNQKNLCFTGGVALNCVANAKILYENIFDQVYIQPQAHDGGTAIGAAYYIWTQILKQHATTKPATAFLGPEFSDAAILHALKGSNLKFRKIKNPDTVLARLIAEGNLIALFQGAMESGPRALGHRSILGDPRNEKLHDIINKKVKFREPFRPLCPSVMIEDVNQWFDMNGSIPDATRYMLAAMNILPGKRNEIPAVVHVDGSVRMQVVDKDSSPFFWSLLNEFKKITGVPLLINTSFNIQEPIVCTPENAITTFSKSKINFLSIGNFLCERN